MPVKDQKLSDQLKAVREDLSAARDEADTLFQAVESAKEKVQALGEKPTDLVHTDDFKAAQQAVKEHREKVDVVNSLTEAEVALLELMGQSTSQNGGKGDTGSASPARAWDAAALLAGEPYKQFIESGVAHSDRRRIGSVSLGDLPDRDSFAGFMAAELTDADMQNALPSDRRGFVTPVVRRLTLLDLIPTGTTDAQVVEYVAVTSLPDDAAEWTPGTVKPEVAFTTEDRDAPVRTIAGWLKVRKHALDDVAGLRTMIGTLLPWDVRRRIESQILVGDGVGQNLKGILNTTGIGAPEEVTGDNPADKILRAITVVVLSDGDPNFVAAHPLAWQDLLLMREDTAGAGTRTGAYLYGTPASPQAPTIWGLSLLANRAVPQETPLIGDASGVTLLVREGVQVLVSDSDQDDFIRNRATLLAEARVALPVWRPGFFSKAAAPAGP
jgi:hypothetical protein